jgi:hypothetical protein
VPLAASPCPSAIGCASGECRADLAGGLSASLCYFCGQKAKDLLKNSLLLHLNTKGGKDE